MDYRHLHADIATEVGDLLAQRVIRRQLKKEGRRFILRAYRMNRRAAKMGCTGRVTAEDLIALVKDYDSCCAYCLRKLDFSVSSPGKDSGDATFDHVKALALGGTGDKANLVPACLACNAKKAKEEGRIVGEMRQKEGNDV